MGQITQGKYSVNARLLALETEMVELRKQYAGIQLIAGPQGLTGRDGAAEPSTYAKAFWEGDPAICSAISVE